MRHEFLPVGEHNVVVRAVNYIQTWSGKRFLEIIVDVLPVSPWGPRTHVILLGTTIPQLGANEFLSVCRTGFLDERRLLALCKTTHFVGRRLWVRVRERALKRNLKLQLKSYEFK
jgi:hypothetical protein